MKPIFLLFLILIPSLIFAQELTVEQKESLIRESVVIDQNKNFEDSKWNLISDKFQNKKLVLLGEFNHGAKEIFEIRNSLIKYLHQHHNFDVILFEAGIGELIIPNYEKKNLAPKQMTYGFFGGWRTKEFTELMEYVKVQDLQIAGFDVQRFGRSFQEVLTEIASAFISDSTIYKDLENRFTLISGKLRTGGDFDSLNIATNDLITDYRKVCNLLSDNSETSSSPKSLLTVRTLLNRIAYLEYYLQFNQDRNWSKRWAARDSVLASNIEWLSQNIFKDKKIIVVAHNFHIARYNEKEHVMGEILSNNYGNEMYSLGMFAGSGSYANNSGKEEFMSPSDSTQLDIKHIISVLAGYATYLDLLPSRASDENWLNQKIIVNDTFIDLYGSNQMVLPKQFDGLLLLKTISPPSKE